MPVLIIYSIATIINLIAIYLIFFKFNPKKYITLGNVAAMLMILVLGPVANMVFFVGLIMSFDNFILLRWK